ncbi:MAG: DEAD/DEAH box helicase family protein [Rhodospirillales bacterium]|nr:DEAD/DEAH box helicase family protein [Rhodospirillales bacterium]
MARWKESPEDTYRFAVQPFFEPTEFLRTLRDWILFYVKDGETRKAVLRQHQRRAVDRIMARCAEGGKQRGLIWHTQGSGKTFTLLTAARLILEQKPRFRNPTVVVVVDRLELEGQLKGWFERLLGEMQQQDILASRIEGGAPGVPEGRPARSDSLDDSQVRGNREGRQYTRQHLRLH